MIDQAAQLLGLSRRTIYNRINEGRLETIRTAGGTQRVTLDSLERQPEWQSLSPTEVLARRRALSAAMQ